MRLIPSNNIYSFSFISNSKHIMEVITFLFFTILCLAPSARCSDPLQSTSKNLQEQQNFRTEDYSAEQKNRKEDDQIQKLPGQSSVNFIQYSGYVAVGSKDEKALFYYFTQSEDPTNKPLVLWLTGGPGCSSFGYGAMSELGPFRVNPDETTLWYNEYSWNKAANVLFLESPAGVGFSYSKNKSDYITGDKNTAQDTYTFLVKWFQKFPEYKSRALYLAGSSYAGHYVPQLADLILKNNKIKKPNNILNLKGIIIGNAEIDEADVYAGKFDYMWTHALISDETHEGIIRNCKFSNLSDVSDDCINYINKAYDESGNINPYNIYVPSSCDLSLHATPNDLNNYNPCSMKYVTTYLNKVEVQKALHVNVINGKPMKWTPCNTNIPDNWTDSPNSVLPIIKNLMANGIRVLINSGDIDSVIPVTSTEYSLSKITTSTQVSWYPWCSDNNNNEVGGYAVGYNKNMVFATLRGAGHGGAVDQPKNALTLIASFLAGKLPPSCGK